MDDREEDCKMETVNRTTVPPSFTVKGRKTERRPEGACLSLNVGEAWA